MVPEAAASKRFLTDKAVQQKREETLQTHSVVLQSAGDSESFRPRRRYRTSVEKGLNMWDNQVRVSVNDKGLWWWSMESITYFDGSDDPEEWPVCGSCADQGSDQMSFASSCLYFEPVQLNMWEWWDFLRGSNRCVVGMIQDEDLKPLVHLLFMAINLPHGPEASDYRFKQIVDCTSEHFRCSSPRPSPLFQHLFPELAKELDGIVVPVDGETLEEAIWRHMHNNSMFKKNGNTAHIGRYGCIPHEGLKLLKVWNQALFEATVLAAEGHMINKKALTRVKLRTVGADDAFQLAGNGTSSLQEADRTLRSCGVNALVCTMATLSDFHNKRLLGLVAHIPKHVMDWSDNFNRELRKGVKHNQSWFVEQLEGGPLPLNACSVWAALRHRVPHRCWVHEL